MDETFGSQDSQSRVVTNPDSDFHIMTQISRLPATALQGQLKSDGIYEFQIAGHTIHLPLGHLNAKHAKPLTGVLGHLLQAQFDQLTFVSSMSSMWIFVWHSSEQLEEEDIHRIFAPQRLNKAA